MKLFLDMLSALKVNYIRYIIPQSLRAQANRSNEFVNLEEVHVLLESIEKAVQIQKSGTCALYYSSWNLVAVRLK